MGKNLHLLYHRKIAKDQRGFSLPEVLVVVALSALVILGNSAYLYDFVKGLDKIEKESMEETELAILSKSAVNSIKRSALSFNRLKVTDDNNDSFYDYYPDIALSSFASGDETRVFTLKATDSTKYFYLLSSEESDFDSIVYDPVHAYTTTDSGSVLSDGTLAYRGINSVPDLESDTQKASQKLMSAVFEKRWADGEIFVVTCPTYLRKPITPNGVDLTTVPRPASYVGKVLGDDLIPLPVAEAIVDVGNTNPVTGIAYTSLNNYFLKLPTVGGAAPFVKVEPAELNRFEMVTKQGYPSGVSDLILTKWKNGKYQNPQTIAEKIKQVRFVRKSVTLPLIGMEIEK